MLFPNVNPINKLHEIDHHPDKGICGSSFFELNNEDFQELKIKMGPRKILEKLIKECREEQVNLKKIQNSFKY